MAVNISRISSPFVREATEITLSALKVHGMKAFHLHLYNHSFWLVLNHVILAKLAHFWHQWYLDSRQTSYGFWVDSDNYTPWNVIVLYSKSEHLQCFKVLTTCLLVKAVCCKGVRLCSKKTAKVPTSVNSRRVGYGQPLTHQRTSIDTRPAHKRKFQTLHRGSRATSLSSRSS